MLSLEQRRSDSEPLEETRTPAQLAPTAVRIAKAIAPDDEALGVPAGAVRLLAAGVLIASFLGRALAQALPGSRSGIGSWIVWTERAAALVTQLFVVAAVAVALRLISITLRTRGLRLTYRVVAVVVSAAVVTLVMVATQHVLGPPIAVGLALGATLLPLMATPRMVGCATTRAAGLVLSSVGLAGLCHVASRVMSIRAAEDGVTSLFASARAMATVSFFFDVFSLAVLTVWLFAGRWRKGITVAIVMIALSVALAWGAEHGSQYAAPMWKVLAARVHSEILGPPAPFIPAYVRFSVELLAWLMAGAALLTRSRPGIIAGLLSLAILTRASPDVPVLALSLVLAGLLGPLAALRPAASWLPVQAGRRTSQNVM